MISIAFFVVSGLLVWVIQTSGPTKFVFEKLAAVHPLFGELFECDFCLGCWVIGLLAWPFGINFLDPVYVPVVSEIVTGIVASFAIHLIKIGWKTKFGVFTLSE